MTFIIKNQVFIIFEFITQLKILFLHLSLGIGQSTNFFLLFGNFDFSLIKLRMEMELFFFILLNILVKALIESFYLVELKLKIFDFLVLFL